jgi:hypothetical protein
MAARSNRSDPSKQERKPGPSPAPVSAEAALSFLKDTKGVVSWTLRDLVEVLKIGRKDAEQVVALLEAQGYVARSDKDDRITTAAGEAVSGAKMPRFGRESVEQALDELKARIEQVNKDRSAAFQVVDAVAFGDFLLKERAKIQAADVGVRLASRTGTGEQRSASDAREERQFLKQLKGKAQMLNLRPYCDWMSRRWHRKLM